jgi:hypothetical protein
LDGKAEVLKILTENGTASAKIAKRLLWSCERVSDLLPLNAKKIDLLTDEQEESFDALLLRLNSLTAMVQDHITAESSHSKRRMSARKASGIVAY